MVPTTTKDRSEGREEANPRTPPESRSTSGKAPKACSLSARGEPFLWGFGGSLAIGIMMILGFMTLILWNGIAAFYPKPLQVVTLRDGTLVAGEPIRTESFQPQEESPGKGDKEHGESPSAGPIPALRTLYRIGNFDLYNEDFRWVLESSVEKTATPPDLFFVERLEWGPFVGTVQSIDLAGSQIGGPSLSTNELYSAVEQAAERRAGIRSVERGDIAAVNYEMEEARLALKKAGLKYGPRSPEYQAAEKGYADRSAVLAERYRALEARAHELKSQDAKFTITLADVSGREKVQKLSDVVRMYPANLLSVFQKLRIYASRWWELLSQEPREANTEGGIMPAIFGTCVMTIFMALAVAPFGVVAALYLREYARQGRMVSAVRIGINNLAGIPSIVYGVFGLGFFAYMIGAGIDGLLFPERLPNPTYGTGGLLWSSLTLALLTVPVVIVATEEALAAVPQSSREGSLACGASKWQTVKYIVLPRAMPGIMTGLILAMARGAGEVAPLMLVGVVKLAPELPIDHFFPYIHLERSFMHLGFHIYDVGFQSRNSEAAKPMVFVTTLVLITLIAVMNAAAIYIRNRLKRKFSAGGF
ncbi:MAG: phosphate ABC transporter permease PstA [Desulfomonile tiedjei]|nr:phosphate ABC transporter permease PstA [Desulfomonile tiedjei]